MKRLQELGLDTSDASFYIWEEFYGDIVISNGNAPEMNNAYPVYTLQDILDLLPKCIETEDYEFELNIYYHESGVSVFYDDGDITQLAFFCEPTLLESAYEMLVWCIAYGSVKTNNKTE